MLSTEKRTSLLETPISIAGIWNTVELGIVIISKKKKTYPEKAEWTKSLIYSIIDVASKQSPEFRHVVIRSLNLFKWLGNLSKKFLAWALLITQNDSSDTLRHKRSPGERWPEGGQREAASRAGLCAPQTLPPHKCEWAWWGQKRVFSVSK